MSVVSPSHLAQPLGAEEFAAPGSRFTSPARLNSRPAYATPSPVQGTYFDENRTTPASVASPRAASTSRNVSAASSPRAALSYQPVTPSAVRTSAVSSPAPVMTSPRRVSLPPSAAASPRSRLASPARSSPASGVSSAAASPAAVLAAEVRDKEMLAQRLYELQTANQLKLQQLERQMAGLQGPSRPSPTPAGYFATPSRTNAPLTAYTPLATPSALLTTTSFASLDPSSPFAAAWTPSGLAPRLAPAARNNYTPVTPFHSWQTPNGIVASPIDTIKVELDAVDQSIDNGSETSMYAASNAALSPRRSLGASIRSSSASRSASPRAPTVASTAASSPSRAFPASTTHAAGLSASDLDALLASLDSKHQAQVADFQAAEATWARQIEEAEARANQLARRVDAAAQPVQAEPADADAAATDPLFQVTLSVQKDSLLHRLLVTAKYVAPIGVAAYAGFRAWREYERRARR